MKIHNLNLYAIFITALFCITSNRLPAQNGDQILDGIGETDLNARYLFNGDLKDWSRNRYNASAVGNTVTFVTDSRFGKVLSLSGDGSFISLPSQVLKDIESMSISGWVKMRSKINGQYLFDFGKDQDHHYFVAPFGIGKNSGPESAVVKNGIAKSLTLQLLEQDKWIFLTFVINIPEKTIITYTDAKPVAQSKDFAVDLSQLFDMVHGKSNRLNIGKSIGLSNSSLNALIYDFRIYRIPLSPGQVAGIYANAAGAEQLPNVGLEKQEDNLQKFLSTTPQLYNSYLATVRDVEVTTEVGTLPRLPTHVEAIYKNSFRGPKVRVLWPIPTDNSSVLKAGHYTLEGRIPGTDFRPKASVTVNAAKNNTPPTLKLAVFPLDRVTLDKDNQGHSTKFIQNRDKFVSTLASTDPDSFLYMFRHTFGQEQPEHAKPLGVWDGEDTKLRGHATGHYLSAIAQAYAGSENNAQLHKNFGEKMEYMVNTLYSLSQLSGNPAAGSGKSISDPAAIPFGPGKKDFDSDLSGNGIRRDYWNWGKGYISAYPPDQFIMLEKGAKYGGENNRIWAPYYTLHKILAGLLDVYEVSGNTKALATASNMGDWVCVRLNALPQPTLSRMWNTYIAGEFGGMNESMAHLYRITKKEKYLKAAQLFDNTKVFFGDEKHSHGLAKNVDVFRGLHANQHIPQIVGSIEMYRESNNIEYFKIADNFWNKIVDDYMYSIGGVAGARNPANAECFAAQPATLYENGFSEVGQNETCATYNMLKLTGDLFLFEQKAELMDYYERGLYNHILASVAENNAGNTYHVSLRAGAAKQFSNEDMTGFTCCNGTALESSTKLQSAIYFRSMDNTSLYVNLYIPSTLQWKEKGITVKQLTDFPYTDNTRLVISGKGKFRLNVRVPAWATKGFFITVNGTVQPITATPGTYLTIDRNWKNGDVVELRMPFDFHLEPVMDQQNVASLFYGPVLLAAQETEARKDWPKIKLDKENIGRTIEKINGSLEFKIGDILLKPFYNSYGRYSVYFDVRLE